MAAALVVALLSLVGLPPLGGFIGKLTLFTAAIDGGYAWLALLAVANTVLSLFSYLRVIGPMYFAPVLPGSGAESNASDASTPVPVATLGAWSGRGALAATVAVVAIGLGAQPTHRSPRRSTVPAMTLTAAGRLRVLAGSLVGAMAGSWWWRHARSSKVQAWRPSIHRLNVHRPLAARSFGQGDDTIVLLHGLGATGDYWGAAYDELGRSHRVLIPDLLGFGRSIDEDRASFGIDDHLDALDRLLDEQVPDTERLTVVSHSMGSALALAWASRHPQRMRQVMCLGAPLYDDADAAREALGQAGPMAKIFLLDTDWAQRACALSCVHRTASGFLAAVAEPSLPLAVTRESVLHTWPAYRDALTHLVLQPDWPGLLLALDRDGVPVTLLWGAQDPIGDTDQAGRVTYVRTQTITIVPGADHHIPITHSSVVLEALESTARTHLSR